MTKFNEAYKELQDFEKQKKQLEIRKLELESTELKKGKVRFIISSIVIPLLSTFGTVFIVWKTGILQSQGTLNEAKSIEFRIKRDSLHRENDSLRSQNVAIKTVSDSLKSNFAINFNTVQKQKELIAQYDSILLGKNVDLGKKNKYVANLFKQVKDAQDQNAVLTQSLDYYKDKVVVANLSSGILNGTNGSLGTLITPSSTPIFIGNSQPTSSNPFNPNGIRSPTPFTSQGYFITSTGDTLRLDTPSKGLLYQLSNH